MYLKNIKKLGTELGTSQEVFIVTQVRKSNKDIDNKR